MYANEPWLPASATAAPINIHSPNIPIDGKHFFDTIEKHLSSSYKKHTITCGDFNCVENTNLDKSGDNTLLGDDPGNQLTQMCKVHHLVDVFRLLHHNKRSWSAPEKASPAGSTAFMYQKPCLAT